MNARCFFALTLIAVTTAAQAQTKKVTFNSLKNSQDALPVDLRYRYPQFLQGQVFYKDGNQGAGRLNYNLLVPEIQFIDVKGDTLALDKVETVKWLTIGTDTFYYNKGVLEVLEKYADVHLAVKEKVLIKDRQKVGAYGMANSGGSIDTYESVRVGQGTYKLGINENVVLEKDRDYYLLVKEKFFLPLSWNNILKAFPASRQKLESFVAANKINTHKEEDLLMLLPVCIQN